MLMVNTKNCVIFIFAHIDPLRLRLKAESYLTLSSNRITVSEIYDKSVDRPTPQ
jgi:hypothetical protein